MSQLDHHTVMSCERLLQAGMGLRRITRVLQISRTSVRKIARKTHTSQLPEPPNVKRRQGGGVRQRPQRCPECGHMVYMPCFACAVEQKKDEQRRLEARLGARGN